MTIPWVGDGSYLAGRFYGTGGMEVGAVFMETGQISGNPAMEANCSRLQVINSTWADDS